MAQKKLILVVEDDDDTRTAICTILEGYGFDFIEFGLPNKALEGISGQKLDLALLDVMMPEMNGYQLLEKIKQLDEFKELPAIMVTAKDQDSEVLEGYQAGADYYITKPFTTKQLIYGINLFLSPGGE